MKHGGGGEDKWQINEKTHKTTVGIYSIDRGTSRFKFALKCTPGNKNSFMSIRGQAVKSPFQAWLHADSFAFCLQAHLVMKVQLCDRRAKKFCFVST